MKLTLVSIAWLAIAGCGRLGFEVSSKASGDRPPAPDDGRDAGTRGRDAQSPDDASSGVTDASCPGCAADASNADAGPIITMDDVTWSADKNLSFDNTPGRSCSEGGDMVSYSVLGLTVDSATLDRAPEVGCLGVGDEVLLISLRGNGSATQNVGKYELLRVASISGTQLGFDTPKREVYGEGATDEQIGLGSGQHRVVVQRVPTYGNATLLDDVTLRSYAWDGARGGVFAMRVQGTLRIDGTIDLRASGFAGGPQTLDASSTGAQGESLSGPGSLGTTPNRGGGGGGLGDGMGCRQSGSGGGGAGHAITGAAGSVPDCNAMGGGAGGSEIGSRTRLLLGSGGGAGGTDNVRTDNPPGGQGGQGGGVVLLLAHRVTGTGGVYVDGTDGQGDAPGVECSGGSNTSCWDHSGPGGGGAGGTIRIEASSVATELTFSATGGKGGNGNDVLSGNGGDAGHGRVELLTPP